MKIEAHIIAWNESQIIGLVIKHYQKFCDHITIWDNYSDDSTQLIAESMGCDVKKFGIKGQLDDQAYLDVKNNCWKGSDADWVIVADTDEILWAPNIKDYLLSCQNELITIPRTIGWQIMSDSMPISNLLEITNGYRFDNYSKSIIFNPKKISDIRYNYGAHKIEPIGDIKYSTEYLYVLHYKHIGGVNRTINRYCEYKKRMSYNNKKNGHGIHYLQPENKIISEWQERFPKCSPLI